MSDQPPGESPHLRPGGSPNLTPSPSSSTRRLMRTDSSLTSRSNLISSQLAPQLSFTRSTHDYLSAAGSLPDDVPQGN